MKRLSVSLLSLFALACAINSAPLVPDRILEIESDQISVSPSVSDVDATDIVRFLKTRPQIAFSQKRVRAELVEDLEKIDRTIDGKPAPFRVQTNSQLAGRALYFDTLYVRLSDTGAELTFVGSTVIDAD